VNRAGDDIDNFLDISPIISNNREVGAEVKRGLFLLGTLAVWSFWFKRPVRRGPPPVEL
jgi:iron complex outermembrane recepter protein